MIDRNQNEREKATMLHIHRPPHELARAVRRCTTCRRRRRFVVKLFEWYDSDWICGGCGHLFTSGSGRVRSRPADCSRRISFVREFWPKAKRLRGTDAFNDEKKESNK